MPTQSTPRLPLPGADQQWMQNLQKALWRDGNVVRQLQLEEFTRIRKLVKQHELPCELLATGPINGFTLFIYDHTPAFGVKPNELLRLNDGHHPLAGQGHAAWGKILVAYSTLTNNPRNEQLAAYYKLQAPKPLGHYEY